MKKATKPITSQVKHIQELIYQQLEKVDGILPEKKKEIEDKIATRVELFTSLHPNAQKAWLRKNSIPVDEISVRALLCKFQLEGLELAESNFSEEIKQAIAVLYNYK
jgi:hypothetical protein